MEISQEIYTTVSTCAQQSTMKYSKHYIQNCCNRATKAQSNCHHKANLKLTSQISTNGYVLKHMYHQNA